LDFAEIIGPFLEGKVGSAQQGGLRGALDRYEDAVVKRSRSGVLASRRASMDAHEWAKIDGSSPLLSRRQMHLDFDDESVAW
jgi:hypothetical protein